MSLYTVTSIPLAPIAGVHGGTGTHQNSNWLVVPSTVPGSGLLQFTGEWVQVTTMLFALNANVVPNWFGVAIPNGVEDFTKANIFFHPLPAQAGYVDGDYPSKGGPKGHEWTRLFYYMERLGYQLDGAARNQIIIMPFLTSAATNTGIFLINWFDIVTDILTAVRSALGADDGSPLSISQVVVSSFSVGIVYSANFRASAANLGTYLAEVWDFDGLSSSLPQLSKDLVSTAQYTAIKYDQNPGSGASNFHVPQPRWTDYVEPPQSFSDVHALIRDFMFLHAASVSNVGGAISGGIGFSGTTGEGGPPSPGTGPAPSAPGPAAPPPMPATPPGPPTAPEGQPPPPPVPQTPPTLPPSPQFPPPPAPQVLRPTPAPPPAIPSFPAPQTPQYPGPPVPQPAAGATPQPGPPGTPAPGTVAGGGASCSCTAIVGMVSTVATTATTAVTAITGIARMCCCVGKKQ
jgi:hypothetical protein